MDYSSHLVAILDEYRASGISEQLDYSRLHTYSLITHSTAIEGSTITETENTVMFDAGITPTGKTVAEMHMNLDLKAAYIRMAEFASIGAAVTVARLKELAALVMRNTGTVYRTALGDFSSSDGDLRLLNVTAGLGGRSYMAYNKVPQRLKELCESINAARTQRLSIADAYGLSFDAHYNLATIHPWADGNGRMARLLMNWLQIENGLVPSYVQADERQDYIAALVATRETADLAIFRDYMFRRHAAHLRAELDTYYRTLDDPGLLPLQSPHRLR